MNHKRLWISATIIAIVILIGFVLSVPHTRDVREAAPEGAAANIPTVTLRDVFKKGVHTITGSVEAPNACTFASAEAMLQGDASTTQSILVNITLPTDTGVCLQLPTRAAFETTITAPARLPFTVMVNGSMATSSML